MEEITSAAQVAEALAPRRAEMAQAIVAQVYGLEVRDMWSAKRGNPRAALARQIAMYLTHIVFRMSITAIGSAFGRDRSTAWHALHHVEDMRDDPDVDRILMQLEIMLRKAAGGAA